MTESKISAATAADIEAEAARLVHDMATPLLTLQLHVQALSTCLPSLLEAWREQNSVPSGLSHEQLANLAELPHLMADEIKKICKMNNQYSAWVAQRRYIAQQLGPVVPVGGGDSRGMQPAVTIRRILLVEDERIHQEIVQKQLAGTCEVEVAESGPQALQLCHAGVFDLILLDYVLPGSDGRGLVQAIRQSASAGALIVGFTNMSVEQHVEGVVGHIAKPFRKVAFDELLQSLNASWSGV